MRAPRGDFALAVPGFLLVGLFLLWAAADGGLAAATWYPGALFALGLVVVVAGPARGRLPNGWAAGALALLLAFAAWSFASIAWSDVRADAWDGANRSLLYALVYAVFVLLPWGSGTAAGVVGVFSLGAAGLGMAALVDAASSSRPLTFFIDSRFVEPLGYANGTSALFLIAFWPALFLSSRREVPLFARPLLLGAAGVLVELSLIPQSRGALFAFPLALVLYFALVPGRVRSALALLPVAVALAVAREPLLDVFRAAEGSGQVGEALVSARNAIILSFAALALVGLVLGLADRLLTVGERSARIASVALAGIAVVGLTAGGVAAALAVDSPRARLAKEWSEFKAGGYQGVDGDSRFSAVGSNRYDFWRVGLGEFEEHPVGGIGADNFAVPYVRERRSSEETLFPHSLEVMVLSQTGVVGSTLFVGFFVLGLGAARKRLVSQAGFPRALTATLVVAAGYWFLHGSVDWFWELPALTGSALAFLAMAGASETAVRTPVLRGGRPVRLALSLGAAAIALAVAASFTFPWLSAREKDRATAVWTRDPSRAYELLERARRLNPLSDHPDAVAGAIASRRGEWRRMRDSFARALERNQWNWYSHLELALAEAQLGRTREALRSLARAQILNPREPIIREVRERVESGKPVDPDEIDRRFVRRAVERLS